MLPRSDELEALHARAKQATAELARLKGAEVTRAESKTALAAIAREWLKVSPAIRHVGVCEVSALDAYDGNMQALLSGTTTRARASALRKHLTPFVTDGVDDIIVPLIQFEGSPRQVAARQVQSVFPATITTEEVAYIEEAARCITVQCYRAAIIMLWAAGVARLHGAIVNRGFNAFNAAVDACVAKKGQPFNRVKDGAKVSGLAELQRARDADLLVIGLELFGYDLQIFQDLDRLLGVRNDAAHPGQFQPTALDVQQFAQKLSTNVFGTVIP
jgi:hypothetical protein